MDRPVTVLTAEESAARTLRRAGYQVIEVLDGGQVVDHIREDAPDAAVIEVFLPGISGLDVCRQLQAAGGTTPILLLGTGADAAARVEGLRAGADDFLVKPYDPSELVARVESLVRRRRRSPSRPGVPLPDLDRDPVTGLPGQHTVTARLEELLLRATAASEPISVLAVDLDCFDAVNSRHGRGAGDRLLAACARAISRVLRDEDFVARAGGNEFLVLLPELHFAACVGVAEKVWRAVTEAAIVEAGTRVSCGASVGVASYPGRDVDSSKDLLRFAHAALARAKAEGRGHICLYQHHGFLLQPT